MKRAILIGVVGCIAMVVMGASNSGVSHPSHDEVIQTLKEGNARFVAGESTHQHTDKARLGLTSTKGQHPFATVITCSDSRVPVERVFDQGIGDLFVIRVAGNVCDTDEVGSIEYGIDHLETPVLVVLGHTQCGAVTAVAKNAELHGSIPPLVDNIQPAVKRAKAKYTDAPENELIEHCVRENIWQSVEDLLRRSEAARRRMQAGTLKIYGAMYELDSGNVKWYRSRAKRILKEIEASGYTLDPHVHAASPDHAESHAAHQDTGGDHAAAPQSEASRAAIAKAMASLKEGNARFVSNASRHPRTEAARISETATKGQHPFATVITCSDSRVPVERVFDQGVGDLFVIRVAGNVCDTDEVGSIEYGVDHLETPVLVVLGHTQCGAVTAVAKGAELHGSIPPLVDNILPAVERARTKHVDADEHDLIARAIEENVWQGVEDLLQRSPSVRKRARDGKVEIVGAIYDLSEGKVIWLDSRTEDLLAGRKVADSDAEAKHAATDHDDAAAKASTSHNDS